MCYYLIGENVTASLSKRIHNLFGNENYELLSLNEKEVKELLNSKIFSGLNVTKPYKELCLDYLDEIDSLAKKIGAVNIILNKHNKLVGYNSDYYGLKYLLDKNNVIVENKDILILGTGGSAKMIAQLAADLKAKSVTFVSRNKSEKNVISYNDAKNIRANILFNATPIGQYPYVHQMPNIDLKNIIGLTAVVDLNYNPLKNLLLQSAESLHILAINGLDMLIEQARISENLFLNKKINVKINAKVKRDIMNDKNIILIGMPYAGKTVIGKELSKILKKEFIDVDDLIEASFDKSIPEIIEDFGIGTFRATEKNLIEKVSKLKNVIIATGGGAVTNKQNMVHLKENGTVFCLNRAKELIAFDNSRPLCQNSEAFDKLYQERKNLYQEYADYQINNDRAIEDVAKEIVAIYEKTISN